MSGDRGNFHHQQQQYAYSNGGTHTQVHQSSTSYTTTSQSNTIATPFPVQQPTLLQSPPMQPLLQASSVSQSMQQIHNQAWSQAQQHHASAVQGMQQNMQSIFLNVQPSLPAPSTGCQQQVTYQQQAQIQYPSSPGPVYSPQPVQYQQTPMQLPAPPQLHQLAAAPGDEESSSEEESSDSEDEREQAEAARKKAAKNEAHKQAMLRMMQVQQDQLLRLEESQARDRKEREARDREVAAAQQQHEADKRRLEHDQTRERQEREAKDREVAALRQQIDMQRQRQLEQEQKHSRELASLASQASSPQPHSPLLDMAALEAAMQRIIRGEIKAHHHDPADIALLMNNAMAKHLHGVVRKEDLERNVKQVEQSLSKVRSGATPAETQQAVERGIESVMQQYARKQQARLESAPPPEARPWEQGPQSGMRTEYTIEEVPEEPVPVRKSKSSSSKSRALPAPENEYQQPANAALTHDALARIRGDDERKSGKSHSSKSRASVMPSIGNALARTKRSTEPAEAPTALTPDALARLPAPEKSSSKSKVSKTRASVQPSEHNALVRVKRSIAPSEAPSSLTPDSLARLPGLESSLAQSKSSKTRASVPPSEDNALARVKRPSAPSETPTALTENALARLPGPETSSSKSKSSKTRTSVQPSDNNALVRPKRSEQPPAVQVADFADTPLTATALARVKGSDSRSRTSSSKKSTASVQPSASNAIARPVTGDSAGSPYRSSAEAMQAAQAGQLSPRGGAGHDAYEDLPDDFPDNASQVTSWQRGKDAKPKKSTASSAMKDNNTVARVQPKNDWRAEAMAPRTSSGLKQVTYPEEAGSNALVRQSKDVARRSSKK